MSYEIVTVATKSSGRFQELINNKFNHKVKVLGMGKNWTGFRMKYELVYNYIKDKNNNDIVIFLDGFDSEIKQNPDNAYKIFVDKGYKLLFSVDPINPKSSLYYKIAVKTFGLCKDGYMGNSGMYMGKVEYLKQYLLHTINQKCKDDQRILNNTCSVFDYIDLDIDEEIFQNSIQYIKNPPPYNNKAVFVSYPGTMTSERVSRSVFEYSQFFLKPIILVYFLLLTLIMFLCKGKNTKYILVLFITLLWVIWLVNLDYSCT